LTGVKCTNKILALFLASSFLFSGCGKEAEINYDLYNTSNEVGLTTDSTVDADYFFSSNIAVVGLDDVGDIALDGHVAEAAGLFNGATLECMYAQNVHERLYPASVTKIMTALVALKYGDPEQVITVSEEAAKRRKDASNIELKEGDRLTLNQLLYGLMLPSGNDAAKAIAEGVGGSIEEFVEMMNKEAAALGATNTHFVNPNGLHEDEHYSTVYDMYLIFNEALKNEKFVEIISTDEFVSFYTDASGATVEKTYKTSNGYLAEEYKLPQGVTIIGGKTGTTNQAGHCLALYSKNEKGEPIISIVFKADSRTNTYLLTREMLEAYANL